MRDQPLLEILRDIKANGPSDPDEGLCRNVHYHGHNLHSKKPAFETLNTMLHLFQAWPEGTGMKDYPVPGINGKDRQVSFSLYSKWSPVSPYGRLRWKMINWMIQELEK